MWTVTFFILADRAKSIRTVAKVNEEATNKLIQDLIKEKERLLKELEGARSSKEQGISGEELQKLREEQEEEVK